jgi:hypothetical protein
MEFAYGFLEAFQTSVLLVNPNVVYADQQGRFLLVSASWYQPLSAVDRKPRSHCRSQWHTTSCLSFRV